MSIASSLLKYGFEREEGNVNRFFKKNCVDDAITYSVEIKDFSVEVEVYRQWDVDNFETLLKASLGKYFIDIKAVPGKRLGEFDSVTLHDTRTGVAVTVQ